MLTMKTSERLFAACSGLCWLIICLLSLTATGCSAVNDDKDNKNDEETEYIKVGDRVPLFTVNVVKADGTSAVFSTEHLTGETIIVLFNTSCKDCQRELPRMNSYYLQHIDDPGFQMVAISREEGAGSIEEFWKANQLSIPYSAQADRRIYNMFASSVIPRVYFCSADGTVTKIFIEEVDMIIGPGGQIHPLD